MATLRGTRRPGFSDMADEQPANDFGLGGAAQAPVDGPAMFSGAPMPQAPPEDDLASSIGKGSTDKPRDIPGPGRGTPTEPGNPDVGHRPPPEAPPSTGAAGDSTPDSNMAPARPRTPTPVVTEQPKPFVPLQPTASPMSLTQPVGGEEMALTQPSMAPTMPITPTPTSVKPRAFVSNPFQVDENRQASLLGQAGGLLGGGMGLPGGGGDFDADSTNLDSLIRTLLQGR